MMQILEPIDLDPIEIRRYQCPVCYRIEETSYDDALKHVRQSVDVELPRNLVFVNVGNPRNPNPFRPVHVSFVGGSGDISTVDHSRDYLELSIMRLSIGDYECSKKTTSRDLIQSLMDGRLRPLTESELGWYERDFGDSARKPRMAADQQQV